MKKLFLALGLVAASALASCAGGAVDYAKFAEEAGKIEDHEYKTATINVKETVKGKTFNSEKLFADITAAAVSKQEVVLEAEDIDEKTESTFNYTYDPEEGVWNLDEGNENPEEGEEYEEVLGLNLKTSVSELDPSKQQADPSQTAGIELKYDIKYYINPFKADLKASGEMKVSEMSSDSEDLLSGLFDMFESMKLDMKSVSKWDKYGFVTLSDSYSKSTTNLNSKYFEDLGAKYGITINIDNVKSLAEETTKVVTVSYK